jgi:hypothetical protein
MHVAAKQVLKKSAIFASAWFQQKYGYRRLLQIGLVAMFMFIFIVFFAQNIVSSSLLLSIING